MTAPRTISTPTPTSKPTRGWAEHRPTPHLRHAKKETAMTTTDFGLLAPCFWHRVCGGVVIAGETMCEGCRSEWGELIRPAQPVAATTVPVSTEPGTDGPVQTRSPEGDGRDHAGINSAGCANDGGPAATSPESGNAPNAPPSPEQRWADHRHRPGSRAAVCGVCRCPACFDYCATCGGGSPHGRRARNRRRGAGTATHLVAFPFWPSDCGRRSAPRNP